MTRRSTDTDWSPLFVLAIAAIIGVWIIYGTVTGILK